MRVGLIGDVHAEDKLLAVALHILTDEAMGETDVAKLSEEPIPLSSLLEHLHASGIAGELSGGAFAPSVARPSAGRGD